MDVSGDLDDVADGIPSMGGRKLGPVLRRAARAAPAGTAIVEVGCWLGAGTAQLALGVRDREHAGEVTLHCFDLWQAGLDERRKAARAGLRFTAFEDTLPHVRRTLEPFGVPIRFHQGDVLRARWNGEPISVYVDDLSKGLPLFCHSLATFGPSWIPGETKVLLMDFHSWRKTGAAGHEFQRRFFEIARHCFEPVALGDSTGTSSAMFRYRTPLGTEAWTWLLERSVEALVAAESEPALVRMRREVNSAFGLIRAIPSSSSRREVAALCAHTARRILKKLYSGKR